MLYLNISGSEINRVAFYTSEKPTYNVGDEIYIEFVQDMGLVSSSLNQRVSALYPNHLVFDISGSDLPQAGGLYSVSLNEEPTWENIDLLWEDVCFEWQESLWQAFDTERALLFEKIEETEHLSTLESASYVSQSNEELETETQYVSMREEATYIIYNG